MSRNHSHLPSQENDTIHKGEWMGLLIIAHFQHMAFIDTIFSATVSGICTSLSSDSQTPLQGSIHALNGRKNMQNQAMMKANHQATRSTRNHRIAHNSPGHKLAVPLPIFLRCRSSYSANRKIQHQCQRAREQSEIAPRL